MYHLTNVGVVVSWQLPNKLAASCGYQQQEVQQLRSMQKKKFEPSKSAHNYTCAVSCSCGAHKLLHPKLLTKLMANNSVLINLIQQMNCHVINWVICESCVSVCSYESMPTNRNDHLHMHSLTCVMLFALRQMIEWLWFMLLVSAIWIVFSPVVAYFCVQFLRKETDNSKSKLT